MIQGDSNNTTGEIGLSRPKQILNKNSTDSRRTIVAYHYVYAALNLWPPR